MKSSIPQIKRAKSKSGHTETHADNTRYGMGDYYGTGFKEPIGRMRSDSVGYRPVSKKKLGKAPKSVV